MDVNDIEQALTVLADRFEEIGDKRALELRQLIVRRPAPPMVVNMPKPKKKKSSDGGGWSRSVDVSGNPSGSSW